MIEGQLLVAPAGTALGLAHSRSEGKSTDTRKGRSEVAGKDDYSGRRFISAAVSSFSSQPSLALALKGEGELGRC
jgi:hypothetical protein